jgi:hypothetical protein
MTKRYISPQSGPVDIKTNKDSHHHSQEHTGPARGQNEAYTPTTEEVRSNYDPSIADRFQKFFSNHEHRKEDYAEFSKAIDAEFDRWLRKVKAKAWDEGYVSGFEEDKRFGATPNPYESEEA